MPRDSVCLGGIASIRLMRHCKKLMTAIQSVKTAFVQQPIAEVGDSKNQADASVSQSNWNWLSASIAALLSGSLPFSLQALLVAFSSGLCADALVRFDLALHSTFVRDN